jgi:general secretion pathway protein D
LGLRLRTAAPLTLLRLLTLLTLLTLLASLLALGGCAGQAAAPDKAMAKASYLRERDLAISLLLTRADRDLASGRPRQALQDYRRVLAIDPLNDRARAGVRLVEADRRHDALLDAARAALEGGDADGARRKLGTILAENPAHQPARRPLAETDEKAAGRSASADTGMAKAFRTPISLEFRDATLKQIFELIARHSGLNFLFDKDVRTDQRSSIFLKNTTVEAALYYLLASNQLERQLMDGNTILIYPNVANKQKEYQEMTVKTFYLANAEAKSIANTLKTILKSRDLAIDEKLNLVILRDTPDAVRLATQLVALQDVPEPEVVLDVEVLEVQRKRLLELGVDWPSELAFAPLKNANEVPLTIDQLRRLNARTVGVSGVSATVAARKTDGDANTLAAPRIRVRNKEKAKVVIGDKLPTITTTISSGAGGFASESVNYVDVGLTLNVEPTIYLNNEVGIRISLEVSSLVDTVISKSGTTAYRIGTRSAATMLQLKDGENQLLAGLIKHEERSGSTHLPGLGDLPLVGRLFGGRQDSRDKTEVLLSITPHLVRNIQRPSAGASEFGSGTEAGFRRRPESAPGSADRAPRLSGSVSEGRDGASSGQEQAPPADAGEPPVPLMIIPPLEPQQEGLPQLPPAAATPPASEASGRPGKAAAPAGSLPAGPA